MPGGFPEPTVPPSVGPALARGPEAVELIAEGSTQALAVRPVTTSQASR